MSLCVLTIGESLRTSLELGKDIAGLIGSGFVLVPFFTQESDKVLAETLAAAQTSDEDLGKAFRKASQKQRTRLLRPDPLGVRWTVGGFLLIALSFLVSIVLTLAECTK